MIRTDDDGDLRVVTLDRPDRRNALRPGALDDLRSAVVDADAAVVALRGAGDAFCAGADLDAVAALDDPEAFARRGQRTADAIESADAVVVAEIDGPARGGGVELALACDLRIATPAATFAEPGVRFGLFGAWGGTVRLPRVVGEAVALDLALSGRVADAEEALRTGLVTRVADDPRSATGELLANDPDALRAVKRLLRDRRDDRIRKRAEAEAFAELHAARADDIAADRRGVGRDDGDGEEER